MLYFSYMLGKIRCGIFWGISFAAIQVKGQTHNLPEPMMASSPPPPVGLPLPIDDYIPFFLLLGLLYGVFRKLRLQKD